ncbi:MAG: hypothetical protein L0H79_17360 [Intrasporangium sp.]|uniref:hypothetical protein n=1 Tax=Intrasporangium sp. TaxID=1925024 RepID=UPI002647917D|nr:hypothetical protein [Intrasporangium sp.]MDN5797499.1 hypothetical protein [Intrasporangium sp.]
MKNPGARQTLSRAVFLVPAGIAMLAGVDAALLLVGVGAPVSAARLADLHGMLMVGGFLGTLIAMERAVALRHPLGYAAPLLLGLGGIVLLTPAPLALGRLLLVEGALAFVAVYAALWRRNHDDVVIVELLGAVHLAIGAVLWLKVGVPWLMPWLVGFVVLTICAERVELARLAMPNTGGRTLVLHASALTMTLVATLVWPDTGARLTGLVIASLVVWLVRHDVARKTIRATGLPRFSAAALLGGYVWLFVAALAWIVGGAQTEGSTYDLVVHSVMLGFAISMVMAHAPVILPAVLRRPLPYRAVMWGPLALMHVGLVMRIIFGDVVGRYPIWQAGSVVNVAALLLFFLVAIGSSVARPPKRQASRARRATRGEAGTGPSGIPFTPSTRRPS